MRGYVNLVDVSLYEIKLMKKKFVKSYAYSIVAFVLVILISDAALEFTIINSDTIVSITAGLLVGALFFIGLSEVNSEGRNNLIMENMKLREENDSLKSAVKKQGLDSQLKNFYSFFKFKS